MTPAELKGWRERLGLSTRWLAKRWNVRELTVQRWERNRQPPDEVVADMWQLVTIYRQQAADLAAAPDEVALVPRVEAVNQGQPWPAAWQRAVAIESGKRLQFLEEGLNDHPIST